MVDRQRAGSRCMGRLSGARRRPKRWVVVRPPGGATGILLARADEPCTEPYGQVAVFRDKAGNRWDLLGPPIEA
jgi:hypothetical protein